MKKSIFYINNFSIINNLDEADLTDFKQIKRRLETVDRIAVAAMNDVYNEKVDEIVYASKFGEFERLDKIIEDYTLNNEVSPIKFTGSVQNFPPACFCLTKLKSTPYTCLSSDNNSISAGLIQSLISKNKNILFCYSNSFKGEIECVAALISRENGEIKVEFEQGGKENDNEFQSFSDFLRGKTEVFSSPFLTIRKVK